MKPGPYHHGDLRQALIDIAFAQVDAAGQDSVSVAALAKVLGVSQPAYARHFADKQALLSVVAVRCFDAFAAVLREAVADVPAGEQLRANALAYVQFGRDRPGLYQLMFGSTLLSSAAPESDLVKAARACFDLLLDALQASGRGGESLRDAVRVWASLHGVVQLERFGLLDGPRTRDVAIDNVVDDVITPFSGACSAATAQPPDKAAV